MEEPQLRAIGRPPQKVDTEPSKLGERRNHRRYPSQRIRLTFLGVDQIAENWSSGGVLLEDRHPHLAVGTPISGLITVEGAAGRFRFSAEIVRREVETRKLALRFVNPSRSLLDILNRTEE